MGLPAFSRSTNRNTATGSGRSPWRRRLRLFLESRAPREGASLLVGVAVALRAPVLSSLLARLRRSRSAEPSCAATPRQFRDPGRPLSWVCRSHARDERPRHETQVGMVDAFAACLNLLDGHLSDTSLLCPPNRVKLSSLLEVLKGYRRDWRLPPQLVWPGISYGFAALSGGGFVGTYPVAIGRNHGLGTPPSVSLINRGAKRPRSTREHALRLLTYMVNANTAGVTRALVVYGGGAVIRRGAQSLIQVVWWHIGEALAVEGYNAASADQDKDVVVVRECEECGAPFFVTDRRQRFCPTDPRCAERNRKRRNRQRKRSVERGDRRRG